MIGVELEFVKRNFDVVRSSCSNGFITSACNQGCFLRCESGSGTRRCSIAYLISEKVNLRCFAEPVNQDGFLLVVHETVGNA